MTEVPMPKLPSPPHAETLGQMIDDTSRLLGRVSRNIDGCLVVGYPVPVDALERKVGDVAGLKALAEGLRGQVQAAEVLIGAIRDELGAKKGEDLINLIRRKTDLLARAAEGTQKFSAMVRQRLGCPDGHDIAKWIDGREKALEAANEHRQQVEAELDEVSEILSHGVDKPGTAIEMARAVLERATRVEQLPEGQEARAVPRRLGRYGGEELWTAGDWLIHVRPRDPRYTRHPSVIGYVHEACSHLYSSAYHRIEFADDPSPAEAVARWIENVKRENDGIDVVFGPYGREPLLDPVATHNDRIEAAKVSAAIDESGFGEPVGFQTAAEVNEANTLRVVSSTTLKYATAGSSGIDLPLLYGARQGEWLMPGETKIVNTGVKVQIPPGFEGQIRPRSSSAKKGLLVHLGTVDADYRGEIAVVLTNTRECSGSAADDSARAFWLKDEEKVAQLVICPVARPQIVHVNALDETERGAGGFGSTGK